MKKRVMEPHRKRSHPLKITITPQVYEQLVAVADAFGQTPATLASVAVGQWVAQQARSIETGKMFVEKVASDVGPEMVSALRNLLEMGMEHESV